MRVLFFGDRCSYSLAPVWQLIESGNVPVAIILPAQNWRTVARSHAPVPMSPWIDWDESFALDRLAQQNGVPLLGIGELTYAVVASQLATLAPDLIISACFPRRLPPEILEIPSFGAFNIHPSLLPRWRGPDPLFWTFHAGDRQTGVSVHVMTPQFDQGPIVAQFATPLNVGVKRDDLERDLSAIGGDLLLDLLPEIKRSHCKRREQSESAVTYARMPRYRADWTVQPDWSTERVLRFIQGVATQSTPVWVTTDDGEEVAAIAASNQRPSEVVGAAANWRPVCDGTAYVQILAGDVADR